MRHEEIDPRQQQTRPPGDGWNRERGEPPRGGDGQGGEARGQGSEPRERAMAGTEPSPSSVQPAQPAGPGAQGASERGSIARVWQDIKGRFVDDPAGAIAAAEALVNQAVEDKVRAMKDEATALCARERDEDTASTENLRTRLIRYQAYCERLTSRPAQ